MDLGHERIFGVPAIAAIGILGAAGVVGYLLFFRNSGSGSSGGGSGTGYSPYALAVMQNPDESASISQQNKQLADLANADQAYYQSLFNNLNSWASSLFDQGQASQTLAQANMARQFADFTKIESGPDDPRIQQWIDLANKLYAQWQQQNVASNQAVPTAPPVQPPNSSPWSAGNYTAADRSNVPASSTPVQEFANQ